MIVGMKLPAAIIAPSLLFFGANHNAAAASELTTEECLANHQRGPADTCMPVSKGGSCSAKAFLPNRIEVYIDGTAYSATIGMPYECRVTSRLTKLPGDIQNASAQLEDFVRICRLSSRYDLNFGGLNRGMVDVPGQKPEKTSDVLKLSIVEVYLNHDKTGNSYTKYTCRIRN
jgi:hypothetical protein